MGTLFQQVSTGTQSLDYTEIVELAIKTRSGSFRDHRLQIRVKSDGYKQQCYAIVERWDGNQWQSMHSIPWSAMSTPSKLVYQPKQLGENVQVGFFKLDRDELLRVAELILG